MVKILSLDVSSVSTGWAVLEGKKLVKGAYGIIAMKQKLHGERLTYFETEVTGLIDKYKPDYLYIEDIWSGPSLKTFKILAYYHGAIHKVCFHKFETPPRVLGASSIRKTIGAEYEVNLLPNKREQKLTNKTSKEVTFDFIKKKFRLRSFVFNKQNDITDAIALGLAAYLSLGVYNAKPIRSVKSKSKRKRKGSKKSVSKARKEVPSG